VVGSRRIALAPVESIVVHAAGAVKTIIQMLGIEQKRAAAVTMLGKTVERSADTVRPFSLQWQKL